MLASGAQQTTATPRDEAMIAGVTNRYTPNRLAFLKPLLADQRHYLAAGASMLRYCDTAVLRMAAILDEPLMPKKPDYNGADWDGGCKLARQWFDKHPQDATLSRLLSAQRQERGKGRRNRLIAIDLQPRLESIRLQLRA